MEGDSCCIIETSCHFHLQFCCEFAGHPAIYEHFTHLRFHQQVEAPIAWILPPAPPLPVWDSCTFTPGSAKSHNPEIPWCLEMHSPSLTVAVADLCQVGQVQKRRLELKLFHDLICQCLNTNTQYTCQRHHSTGDRQTGRSLFYHNFSSQMYTCLLLCIIVHHLFIYTTVRPRCRK